MMCDWYGQMIRVRHEGDPREVASDVIVEQQPALNAEWVKVIGFNSMSDDYAFTNARQAATALQKRLEAKE
jgi:hypothetical protein